MSVDDTYQKVTDLRKQEADARTLRARAEANVTLAKQRLEQVEKEIRDLGVDPAKAEVELKALEEQLIKSVAELDGALKQEIARYKEVIRITTEALA